MTFWWSLKPLNIYASLAKDGVYLNYSSTASYKITQPFSKQSERGDWIIVVWLTYKLNYGNNCQLILIRHYTGISVQNLYTNLWQKRCSNSSSEQGIIMNIYNGI